MYDSIKIELESSGLKADNFLSLAAMFDTAKDKENAHTGEPYILGSVGSMKAVASKYKLFLNGSICKYYLGDNFQTLGRADTGRAIEMLSDKLHLKIAAANVRRADFGTNIITKEPPQNYLPRMGLLARYSRELYNPYTLYYKTNDRVLCFYDKNKEILASNGTPPEIYANRNVLRYEIRYLHRLAKYFRQEQVTAQNLSETGFYDTLLKEWKSFYQSIVKEKNMSFNFEKVNGLKDYYSALAAEHIKNIGATAALEQVTAAQRAGNLKPDAAKDIKRLIRKVAQNPNLTTDNQLMQELETKIKQAALFG